MNEQRKSAYRRINPLNFATLLEKICLQNLKVSEKVHNFAFAIMQLMLNPLKPQLPMGCNKY